MSCLVFVLFQLVVTGCFKFTPFAINFIFTNEVRIRILGRSFPTLPTLSLLLRSPLASMEHQIVSFAFGFRTENNLTFYNISLASDFVSVTIKGRETLIWFSWVFFSNLLISSRRWANMTWWHIPRVVSPVVEVSWYDLVTHSQGCTLRCGPED